MEIIAKLKHLRISPRKVRLVTDLIKGLSVKEAEQQLAFNPRRASRPVLKLLRSAIANAKNNFNLTKEGLYVSNIRVDQGPSLKRWRARAMGKGASILKRTSHILLVLTGGDKDVAGVKPVKKLINQSATSIKSAQPALAKQGKLVKIKQDKAKSTDKSHASDQLRQDKKRFYSGDKFKGATKRMFRRKAV